MTDKGMKKNISPTLRQLMSEPIATQSTYSIIDELEIFSDYLDRRIRIDVYLPRHIENRKTLQLLLVNDGQDLPKMPFSGILDKLYGDDQISPLVVAAMHCSDERLLEYGTADVLDFAKRGSRARYHRKFVTHELIPGLKKRYNLDHVDKMGYAGFSLGGLSALDIAWKHPEIFDRVGVFSGSLWWRLRDLHDGYVESTDRIMHKLIREGIHAKGMRFFFMTGTMDETADRNNNGIIDSIDDTLDLIAELENHGYTNNGQDIEYLELQDGRHDVPTWGRAFPDFLRWAYPK